MFNSHHVRNLFNCIVLFFFKIDTTQPCDTTKYYNTVLRCGNNVNLFNFHSALSCAAGQSVCVLRNAVTTTLPRIPNDSLQWAVSAYELTQTFEWAELVNALVA
jgi:hypothetical protein